MTTDTSRRDAQRADSAERMRRSRARRAAGEVRVVYWIQPAGIDILIALGWLKQRERRDSAAVRAAFMNMAAAAARAGLVPHAALPVRQPRCA